MPIVYERSEYVRSAAGPDQFLWDGLPQFAFAGRSNVGKSSVINRLTGRRALAKVGASPGKTRQVNYFLLDGQAYLTDLPGYGYAKVSKEEKARWGRLMERFFREIGPRLTATVLIVDIRHDPTEDDRTMHRWSVEIGRPEIVVANKLDKLKKSQIGPALDRIRDVLELDAPPIPFSAEKGQGRDDLRGALEALMGRSGET